MNGSSKNLTTSSTPEQPDTTKKWNSYCKHISHHKLSEDEEKARTQNNDKYVSYLRSEATKRKERKGSESNNDVERQQEDLKTSVRKRKPPVPRLSRLARSGQNKENVENGKQTSSRKDHNAEPLGNASENKLKESSEEAKPKLGYLDFISSNSQESSKDIKKQGKPDGRPKKAVSRSDETEKEPADEPSVDEDDESKFRSQIERIVERAAEMVLHEQHNNHQESTAPLDTKDTEAKEQDLPPATSESKYDEIIMKKTNWKDELERNLNMYTAKSQHDFLKTQDEELSILEEKVQSLSSSYISENETITYSSNSSQIFYEPRSEYINAASSTLDDIDELAQTQPTTTNTLWEQCFGQKPLSHLLHGIDASSCTTSFLSGLESTSDTTSLIDPKVVPQTQKTSALPNVDENSTGFTSCLGSETTTEVIPRVQVQSEILETQPSAEECPDELLQLPEPVNPSSEPSRGVHWDEEPLPRGYELMSQYQGNRNETLLENDDIAYPRSVNDSQNEPSGGLLDDLFSLLG